MITLNMQTKNRPVRISNGHFSTENNILTLEITLMDGTIAYDLTGKVITAVFAGKPMTAPLTVTEGVIQLPITSDLLSVGINQIQIVLNWGTDNQELSPIMVWPVMAPIAAGIDAGSVDILSALIADCTAINAAEALRVTAEGTRDDAEVLRIAAEGTREENEDTRIANEALRASTVAAIETTYAPRLTAVESDLADMSTLASKFVQVGDTDDTAPINRALAYVNSLGGGKVRIPYRTTPYILSSALIIYSNTHLEVDEFATIKLGNDVNCRMIENANKTTQATLTRIDKNIKITGGIWDGNGTMQSKKWDGEIGTTSLMTGFLFSGIEHFEFQPTKIINTKTYGCLICNVNDLLIENVSVSVGDVAVPNNCDGIHVLGPAENITIQNCKVRSEDNAIAINADDTGHGPYGTFGDIDGVYINNIALDNYDGGQGMLLLSGDHAVKNVVIKNISGKATYLLNLSTFDFGLGNYDNITVDGTHIDANVPGAGSAHVSMRGNFGTVSFKNIVAKRVGDTARNIRFLDVYSTALTPTVIDRLNVKNIVVGSQRIGDVPSNLPSMIHFDTAAVTVNTLNVDRLVSKGSVIYCIPIYCVNSTIKNIFISNFDIDNARYGAMYLWNAPIEKIRCENIVLDTASVNQIYYKTTAVIDNVEEIVINNCGAIYVNEPDKFNKIIVDNISIASDITLNCGYYRKGEMIFSSDPATLGYIGWICTLSGSPYNTAWVATTSYSYGDVVKSGATYYKCISSGTSGSTAPTGTADFTDGSAIWRYMFVGLGTFELFGAIPSETVAYSPAVSGGTSAGTTTHTSQSGFYSKVGKIINFQANVAWSAATGTGQTYVTLPKNVNAGSPAFIPISLLAWNMSVASGSKIVGLINKSNNKIQLYIESAGMSSAFALPASGTLFISGSYIAV